MRKIIIVIAGLAVLVLVNMNIMKREALLASGRTVILELAPVDPRSLMQGDYMALRFRVGTELERIYEKGLSDGHVILAVDAKNVATYRRIDNGSALVAGEIRMRFRVREDHIKFATNAFFFQEGDADAFAEARYGEFRVDDKGDAILTHLLNAKLQRLPIVKPIG